MKQEHWENIYDKKGMQEVSWYQKLPKTSLDLIEKVAPNKDATIIDIGGGDGFLVDELLKLGYTDITVLDISENAINKAKKRLGKLAEQIRWIVADITEFIPTKKYDVWHDRAVFHFLTNENDIDFYKNLLNENIIDGGSFILATFSEKGPDKCCGLQVSKYSKEEMNSHFESTFSLIEFFTKNHETPFGTIQNFIFSVFKKNVNA